VHVVDENSTLGRKFDRQYGWRADAPLFQSIRTFHKKSKLQYLQQLNGNPGGCDSLTLDPA
jgi:hypothetical protein